MNNYRKSTVFGLVFALAAAFVPVHVFAEETEEVIPAIEESAEEELNKETETASEETAQTAEVLPAEEIIEESSSEAAEILQDEVPEADQNELTFAEIEIKEEPSEKDGVHNPPAADLNGGGISVGAIDITTDRNYTVNISGTVQQVVYRFIPDESWFYTFQSYAPDGTVDPYMDLYDSSENLIISNDDSGEGLNFRYVYFLNKGETYYFAARLYSSSSSGSYPVRLHKGGAMFGVMGDSYFTVAPHGSITMQVGGQGDTTKSTVQWYMNEEKMDGATNPILNLSDVTRTAEYRCHCNDGYGWETDIYFNVYVENHLTVSRVGDYERFVEYGDSTTLWVNWSADNTDGIRFRWYELKFDDQTSYVNPELIPGATTAAYTISKVTKSAEYQIEVEDAYGNFRYDHFMVTIDNKLSVKEVGDYAKAVKPNGSVTMNVDVSAADKSGIKYAWYVYDYSTGGEMKKAGTSASYKLSNIKNNFDVRCVVTDKYNNRGYVYYYVYVDNQLKISAKGGDELHCTLYGSVKMEAEVSAADKSDLNFTWYRKQYDYDVEDFVETLQATTKTPEYTIANIQNPMSFRCVVTDQYGGYAETTFYINIIEEYQIALRTHLLDIGVGESVTLIADGSAHKNWSTFEPDIVSVDKNGKVTALKPGIAHINVLDDAKMYGDSCTVYSLFKDVKNRSSYYFDPVYWAYNNGITTGTSNSTFSPNDNISRGQIVTFLWRLQGSPKVSYAMPFTDVGKNKFFYDAVAWAASSGVTTGTSATTFSPNDNCTRGQIVTFLWRAKGSPEPKTFASFDDVTADKFFYKAVSWAYENGITTGTSATAFSPNDKCTRAQAVTFLYRTAMLGD